MQIGVLNRRFYFALAVMLAAPAIAFGASVPGMPSGIPGMGGSGSGDTKCQPPAQGPLDGTTPARMPSDYLTTDGQTGDNMLIRGDDRPFGTEAGTQGVALTPSQAEEVNKRYLLGQGPKNAKSGGSGGDKSWIILLPKTPPAASSTGQ